MTDAKPDILDYLREQFAGVHARVDRIEDDLSNVKALMSAAEAEAGHVRIGLAEVNGRLDRMDKRLDRIERRLELVGAET